MSRTDEKGPGAWPAGARLIPEAREESRDNRVSSLLPTRMPSEAPPESRSGCPFVYDEAQRTRLMADLTRLLREPTMPRSARLAGLTLIGWLARRRADESPHALGIDEARESERRIQSARPKTR